MKVVFEVGYLALNNCHLLWPILLSLPYNALTIDVRIALIIYRLQSTGGLQFLETKLTRLRK